ncbi:MAG: hypothetical protein ACXVPN_12900 [Bacteroidia bacterium]
MKKHLLLVFFGILLITSCKKKDTAPAKVQTSNPTPYAFLTAQKSYMISSGSLVLYNNYATAEFRSDLNNISTDMQIGGCAVGGKFLKYLLSSKTYGDTTNSLSLVPTTWQIAGSGSIPSYTFTNNDSMPVYTGYATLPDTIYKNQNLAIQVNGVSGANSIDVLFFNSSLSTPVFKSKITGILSNNIVNFTTSDLAPLPVGSSTLLYVTLYNDNYQTQSNVTFDFKNQKDIIKTVYIK